MKIGLFTVSVIFGCFLSSCKEKHICTCQYSSLARAIGAKPNKTDTIHAPKSKAVYECQNKEKNGFVVACELK